MVMSLLVLRVLYVVFQIPSRSKSNKPTAAVIEPIGDAVQV